MNPLSLLSGPYGLLIKLGLVAALAVFLYASGYTNGNKRATARCDAAKIEAVQRAIVEAQEIAKQDAELVRNNVQTVEVIRNRTRTIRIKDKQYAKPLPDVCVLDDDRVRNLNDALSNKDADPGKPDYTLPASPKIGR